MVTATVTLADLAITRPGATRVFLKHGLDFCCGGRRPLEEACAEKGLDPGALLAEIEREDVKGGDLTPAGPADRSPSSPTSSRATTMPATGPTCPS